MGDEATTGVETETNDTGTTETASTETVLTGDEGSTETGGADTNSEGDASASTDDNANLDADGNPIADGDADAGTEGSDEVPDTYADFVMPDGVTLDETLAAEALPIFKEMGATQEQAQKLMDIAAKQVQASSQKQFDDFDQLLKDWRTQSENDGEFGGDKFDENVKVAQNAVNKYGTPELQQLLKDHGMGNHPEVIRFMVRVGRTLKEDVPGSSGNVSNKASDRVDRMYPKDT